MAVLAKPVAVDAHGLRALRAEVGRRLKATARAGHTPRDVIRFDRSRVADDVNGILLAHAMNALIPGVDCLFFAPFASNWMHDFVLIVCVLLITSSP